MSKKTKALEAPKARAKAVITRVGEERPHVDTSSIPPLVGQTIRLAFRADTTCVRELDDHLDWLATAAAGVVVTPADAMRSLIREGARSFKEKRDEAEDDE